MVHTYGDSKVVYAWLTHREAEQARLPERIDGGTMYDDLDAARSDDSVDVPADAFYLIRADSASRQILGYA